MAGMNLRRLTDYRPQVVPGSQGPVQGPSPTLVAPTAAPVPPTAGVPGRPSIGRPTPPLAPNDRLERDRLALEREQAEAARARQAEQDRIEQERYADAQRRGERDWLTEDRQRAADADRQRSQDWQDRQSHDADLRARRNQERANDELIRLARGDASALPPVTAGSPPSQLGIIGPGASGGGMIGIDPRESNGTMPTGPRVGGGSGGTGSNTLAQTQVQDRAAQRTQGAMAALERGMIDRGTLGSGLHAGLQGDLIADQGADLLDADVEFEMADQRRRNEIEDRDYAGGQREQDRALSRRQSLLDLLQGIRY